MAWGERVCGWGNGCGGGRQVDDVGDEGAEGGIQRGFGGERVDLGRAEIVVILRGETGEALGRSVSRNLVSLSKDVLDILSG